MDHEHDTRAGNSEDGRVIDLQEIVRPLIEISDIQNLASSTDSLSIPTYLIYPPSSLPPNYPSAAPAEVKVDLSHVWRSARDVERREFSTRS